MRTGWKASTFDARDYIFPTEDFDTAIEYMELYHPYQPRNQGWGEKNIPCCVSCAIVAAMETIDEVDGSSTELSELFHYYVSRPSVGRLSSIDFREGLTAAVNKGVAPRELHPVPKSRIAPMNRRDAFVEPSPEAFYAAKQYSIPLDIVTKTFHYHNIPRDNLYSRWKMAIQNKIPVIFGFWMTPAYYGINSDNPYHGNIEGTRSSDGHAALVIGYDDQDRSFQIKDSRGVSFGNQGKWRLGYSLLETSIIAESWIINKVTSQD